MDKRSEEERAEIEALRDVIGNAENSIESLEEDFPFDNPELNKQLVYLIDLHSGVIKATLEFLKSRYGWTPEEAWADEN